MKHIIKPALSLLAIAAISTAALALVRDFTLEPIANQRRIVQERVKKTVLPQASGFKEISPNELAALKRPLSENMVTVFEGLSSDGNLIGYVVELAPTGYSGAINMMVGISTTEQKVVGMRVIKHSETPGLGALITLENYYRRFDNKNLVPLRVVRMTGASGVGDNEIQAITSATITTVAVTNAVNEAIEWFNGSNSSNGGSGR